MRSPTPMQITPLHDRILVRRVEEGEQTVGGIIIPDSATEKPQQGQVLAVGKGRLNKQGQRVPLDIRVGDRVLFGKYSQETTVDGEDFVILREDEVLAVLGAGVTAETATAKKKTKNLVRKTRKKSTAQRMKKSKRK
jgi:chaperonin GroES